MARWSLVVGLCVVFAVTAVWQTPGAAQADKGTFVFLVRNAPRSLDPHVLTGWSVRSVDPAYETLVRFKPGTAEIIPMLATSWDASRDGLTYTFQLRQGVRFHDGASFNAEAVKVNIERLQAVGGGVATTVSAVERVEAVDARTVKFVLKRRYAPFILALAGVYMVSPEPMRANARDNAQAWFSDRMSGTGPYRFDRWDRANELVLVRSPGYWGGWKGKPIERVMFKTVLETTTQRALLEKGDADLIDDVPPESIAAIKANRALAVEMLDSIDMMYLMLRMDRGPLSNKKVRQALAYAFPYDKVVEVMGGLAAQPRGPIPSAIPQHDSTVFQYKHDLNKAKSLLSEAGVNPESLRLKITIVEKWTPQVRAATLFQASLASIGVQLTIQEMPWVTLLAYNRNTEQAGDMGMVQVGAGMPDADRLLEQTVASKAIGNSYNWSYYRNVRLDTMLEQAAASGDPKQRIQLYRQVQRMIVDDVPAIFVMEPKGVYARRASVKGYQSTPAIAYIVPFYQMSKE